MNSVLKIREKKEEPINTPVISKRDIKSKFIYKIKIFYHKIRNIVKKSKILFLVHLLLFLTSLALFLKIEMQTFPEDTFENKFLIIGCAILFSFKLFSFMTPEINFIFEFNSFFFTLIVLFICQLIFGSINDYYNLYIQFDLTLIIITFILIFINYLFVKKVRLIYFIPIFVLLFCVSIFFCYLCNFDGFSLLFIVYLVISSFNNFFCIL